MGSRAVYFENHARALRFPWSLYHGPIDRRVESTVEGLPLGAKVLTVGCGLSPRPPGARPDLSLHACDLDARAVASCRRAFPELADRIAVSPGPYALPEGLPPFDCIIAKEVIEHTLEPRRFAQVLVDALAKGGVLIVSTPNYGSLTLSFLERTVLEVIARVDGYTRRGIHPSPLSAEALSALPLSGAKLIEVELLSLGWVAFGRWRREG